MALVDEMRIRAKAGKGGDGVVRWLHERGKEFGGPSGGNGGRGGDVIFRAIRDLNVLSKYRGQSEFKAESGESGGGKDMTGASGKDAVIDVPVGTIIHPSKGESVELLEEGEEYLALKGGSGGLGNANFKSSVNQYPTEATKGKPGESDEFKIELQIIADAGIVGLPNAGKSSLLNALTNAGARVGDYAFTTLEPNLGAFFGHVLADIPGLIEGAAEGKGLGHSFLKHIERTKILIHCVSSDNDEPLETYQTVRTELEKHSPELSRKPEIVFLTKADTKTADELERIIKIFSDAKLTVIPVSILDDISIKRAGDSITRFLVTPASGTILA